MEEFAAALMLLLKNGADQLWGPSAARIVVGSISIADICVALCFLLLTILVNLLAAVLIGRHKAPSAPSAPTFVTGHDHARVHANLMTPGVPKSLTRSAVALSGRSLKELIGGRRG